ncbi:MAG TPA: M28 family metallopeptidase [Bacteroidia bacterium]|nr:M28 family metallopeptidase [Bacteroidia bacterium]
MLRQRTIALFISLTICISATAQDLQSVKENIASLASPAMHGRGYIGNSQTYAANFIISRFQNAQLKPLGKQYQQQFEFPVNTFPGKISLSMDGKKLIPGKDFLVHDASGSGKKESAKIFVVSKATVDDKSFIDALMDSINFRNTVFALDSSGCSKDQKDIIRTMFNGTFWKGIGKAPAGIIAVEEKKLTWSISAAAYPYPILVVKKEFVATGRKVSFEVTNKIIPEFKTQNLAGYFNGNTSEDSFIVITAHYDHLGMMGDSVYFPGANDNASGTSMVLDFVKYFSSDKNRLNCKIAFVAFAGEEAGLRGSEYFVNNPMIPLNRIKFLINLDLVGTGDEGIMVVNATEHAEQFKVIEKINRKGKYFDNIGQRGKAKNSDHWHFSEKGVKCFFIYTLGGIAAYHDIYDRAETLPLTKYENLFRLIRDFVTEL